MPIELSDGVTVEVTLNPAVQVTPTVILPYPTVELIPFLALQGPQGEPGADSTVPGPRGHVQHIGDGPPGVIVGAEPGDSYLDQTTGTIWRLT